MTEENASKNYLGDWKDKDAAEAGLVSMQGKMDEIGTEVGTLRQQSAKDAGIIETLQKQSEKILEVAPIEKPDLSKELKEVQTELLALDTADENYSANMVALINKQNALIGQQNTQSAQIQHEKTLEVATKRFTEELSKRDANQTTQDFKKDNPEFETPEMQAKIEKYIAADTTGMVDSLVAFREIQRDEATQQVQGLTEENEKLKNLANLKEGTDSTGNVYTGSGQSPKQTKKTMTNAERDEAMMAAVMAAPE